MKSYIEVLLLQTFITSESYKNSQKNLNNLSDDTLSLITTESNEALLLLDFNVNCLKANENPEFKSILSLYGFTQLARSPTR